MGHLDLHRGHWQVIRGQRWVKLGGLTALAVVWSLAACQGPDPSVSQQTYQPQHVYPDLSVSLGTGQRCLFNAHGQNLVLYDTGLQETVAITDVGQFVVYGFSSLERVYAAGNINALRFVIFEITDGQPATRLKLPPGQAIAPLASDGERFYAVVSERDPSGVEQSRVLASIDTANWAVHTYPTINGLIVTGAIVGTTLYYAAAGERGFDLFAVDLTAESLVPELVENDLEFSDLYTHGGNLVRRVSAGKLAGGGETWACSDLGVCLFPRGADVMVAVEADPATGSVHAKVYDGIKGGLLADVADAVGVEAEDGKVTVYGFDSMRTVVVPA